MGLNSKHQCLPLWHITQIKPHKNCKLIGQFNGPIRATDRGKEE